ncbi:protein Dok-7-like [Centroberyx affinis]|uniref:protein Dok-7-like n=1 Tax=Centroberyx affinis TaxID=166261 RepID=UPI003A5BA2F4
MTDSVVVEGYVKFRDGKKWKTRWVVLRKPSPVADCLVLLVFKDKSDKAQGHRERASVTLEDICGLETGQWYEGVGYTLAVLCLNQAAVLGFDSKEALLAWDIRIRYSLGEVHRFSVGVLPGTKLESGPATLHLCNNLLALARDVPPVIIGHWNLPDLRRYGPVPNGFVFEGGTRCGYWAGVFFLTSTESEQISFLFDCIVRGISPTRGPFGLRPVLPDPNASQAYSEERVNHEAQELEKRLSMLSHRSSTASSTYCPSAGGDDRSMSGSSDTSDTSQSDCSIGSRMAIWTEPAVGSNPSESIGQSGAKVALQSIEKLSVNQGGGSRPAAKAPRQLQEIGRQSSSDSGIATASHSSYSGSFSSYTGSLDIAPAEEYGSVFSLPPHLALDLSPCTCPPVPGHEYQVPTSLRYLYDSPRSLIQEGSGAAKDSDPSTPTKDAPAPSSLTTESSQGDESSATVSGGHLDTAERQPTAEHSQGPSEESKKVKVAASNDSQHPDSCQICSSLSSVSKTIVTICSACGGFKGTPYSPASGSVIPAIPDREPEAKTNRLNLYESMSSAFGSELRSTPAGTCAPSHDPNPQRDNRSVIYENCLKCRGERCHPPPRVTPAQTHRGSNSSTLHIGERSCAVPSGPRLKRSVEEEAAANEPHYQVHGSRAVDGKCEYEDMNGHTVTGEDKRPNSKEERRKVDPAYEIMESRAAEKNSETEEKSKYELMGSCGHQRLLHETEGPVFVFPPEVPVPDRPRGEGVTYVNIPISPTSKKQLNYMELELQEPGSGIRGTSSTKYAQIDITATETAHKVGTQHAMGREEGLHTLELRRKGVPQ